MSRKMKALVCVAHPDDEAIFFGGLIASKPYDWTVVCVTDGNADGLGAERKKQFLQSCQRLKVKTAIQLTHLDVYEKRLDTEVLIRELRTLGHYQSVFTHGPLGEYGHPHHQDVSFAVHEAFSGEGKVFSTAYNIYPELKIQLTPKVFALKAQIYSKIYGGETQRFLNFLPLTSYEGFTRVSFAEVREIYQYVLGGNSLNENKIKKFKWLRQYIKSREYELRIRPF